MNTTKRELVTTTMGSEGGPSWRLVPSAYARFSILLALVRRKFIPSVGVTLVAALIWGCDRNPADEGKPQTATFPAVTVARPAQQAVVEWDEYTGYLAATEFVEVRARVSGLIVTMPFEEGDIVPKGHLLAEIDVRPYQADLDSRLAEEARAAAQMRLAEIELQRIRDMPPEASMPIELQRTEASLSEAGAVHAGAQAAVESARLLVEWCRVTAPIKGRISSRYVDPGNLISGGSGTGTLITTIASVDPIFCYIDADERAVLKYQRLAREQKRLSARDVPIPFYIQLADETGYPHKGMIDFVDNRIDPMTGTIRGRGSLPNPGGWLTPGFFARVRLPGSGLYQAVLVPDSAVATDQNQKFLYVVASDNVVQAKPVQLGALFGELRAIESGIELSDRVVINGLMHARPGAKVAPQEASFPLDSLPPIPDEAIQSESASESAQTVPTADRSEP